MKRQILKTFNGFAITHHDDRRINPFVITKHGKVVEKYEDLNSCLIWVASKLSEAKF